MRQSIVTLIHLTVSKFLHKYLAPGGECPPPTSTSLSPVQAFVLDLVSSGDDDMESSPGNKECSPATAQP